MKSLLCALALFCTPAVAETDLNEQVECIATNVYHEARNQSQLGMRAVAWVTLNRVQHENYPNTACGVVYDAVRYPDGRPKKNLCQFSWFCDGKPDSITNVEKWAESLLVAVDVMHNYNTYPDPTGGSHMYHANYVNPGWAKSYKRVVKIDSHIFYKD
jgi:N-acetylmuramoyl-L-alanine amidase